jgi:hypothetical protein
MHYKDKLGVYCVGDLKFYSKVEAIEMHAKTGIHPHWNFNEEVFSMYDWTQEPQISLEELYRRRAQQLRDQYDYVVLMYSGGADCENILQAFVKNDIKLDEAVSFINCDATGDKDSWLNEEIFKTAIPTIQHIQNKHQNIRHRIIDITKWQTDYFSTRASRYDWIYQTNYAFNPNVAARGDWISKTKDLMDLLSTGKKICVIWGIDKPRIVHTDKGLSLRFLDIVDSAAVVPSISGIQPYVDELFYWTPDLPELVIKQAHIIKNYINGDVHSLPYMTTEKSDLVFRLVDGKKYWLSRAGMHRLIYPDWTAGRVECGKTPSLIFSNRDRWFFNIEDHNPIKQNWSVGLEKLWRMLPDYWKNDPTDISKSVKGCWSKDYYLEKL